MCVVAMMVPDDVRPEWPYGDLITRHVDKLLAAHVMAHMLASASSGQDVIASLVDIGDSLEELAREHNQAKQRGLYADLIDGTVWDPASITKDEARRTLVIVRRAARPRWTSGRSRFHTVARQRDAGRAPGKRPCVGQVLHRASARWTGRHAHVAPKSHGRNRRGRRPPADDREQAQRAAIARVAAPKRIQPRRRPRSRRRTR